MICGRCSAMNHLDDPAFLEALLRAIAGRDDAPIHRLLA